MYEFWNNLRSIFPNDWAIAEFDIPIPTNSLPDRELKTIRTSNTTLLILNGLTIHARRLSFRQPPSIESLTEDRCHASTAQHMSRVVGVFQFSVWIQSWNKGTQKGLKALVIGHL